MLQIPIPQAMQIAIDHHQAGRLDQAADLYQQILAAQPDHADALHLLGVLAGQMGRNDMAVELVARAIALSPANADYHCNLALYTQNLGRLDEAVARYRRALEISPGHAQAHFSLANLLKSQARHLDAIASYQRALELRPDYLEARINLGNAYKEIGHYDDAVACYQRALEIQPGLAEAHNNLGNAWGDMGELDAAVASYRRALELNPAMVGAHDNILVTMHFQPAVSPRQILQETRQWDRQHAAPLANPAPPRPRDTAPNRPLRAGYVSPDFRRHAAAFFLMPLLAALDPRQIQVVCYPHVAAPDDMTARFERLVRSRGAAWHEIAPLSDDAAADRIRHDGIDILIDLTMHMEGNRLGIFARRPAPVQATWLAYPGTTGMAAIDYRLTDPHLDPPGEHDADYAEKSLRLPDTFWCYDPLEAESVVAPPPALAGHGATFGCLNNFCKINDGVLSLWARVLRAVDGSRLLLMAPEGQPRTRVLDRLAKEGIGPERMAFVAKQGRADYLRTYHQIDIGLDTFPYNGHTTSLDASWMGVPVVTLVGQTVVGRAGLSQLTNLGLQELVARTPDDYVRIAAQLAANPGRLRELRSSLRPRMQASPLMDAPRFARAMEAACRAMWATG